MGRFKNKGILSLFYLSVFIVHDQLEKVRNKFILIFLTILKHFRNRDDVSSPKVLTQCKALRFYYKCISAKYHHSLICAESEPGIDYSFKKYEQ